MDEMMERFENCVNAYFEGAFSYKDLRKAVNQVLDMYEPDPNTQEEEV